MDPILFFPVPALDPDPEFLFQFCIQIPTIFSSFSNKFVGYNILLFMLEVVVVMCLWKLLSFWQKILDPTCSGSGSGSTTMVLWSLSANFAVKLFNYT